MQCILPTEVSCSATVYTFALPDAADALALKRSIETGFTGACLLRFTPSPFRLNLHVTGSNLF